MLDSLVTKGFQVEFLSHAQAILSVDFPQALAELEDALAGTTIPIEEIIASGGGEAKGTQRLRKALAAKGWTKTTFVIEKRINGIPRESQSHEVDHVRSFDSGARCVELRRMPDGRWAIATGVSVMGTGKSPWSPFTREIVATADAALADFLALLPDDPTLRDNATTAFHTLQSIR